jgi:antirestriction protein ArdC
MSTDRFDIQQHITNQIVAAIETGVGEFRLPWRRAGGSIARPLNVASKKPYRGVNILALWAMAQEKGFSAGVWGTYKQWAAVGAQVRKGEKAAYVAFFKQIDVAHGRDEVEGDFEKPVRRLIARATPVFAAEQVEGWAPPSPEAPAADLQPHERAEAFVAATGAEICHGGDRAFYRPSTDSIHLPPREAFTGSATSSPAEAYYSVLLHELTHWTSHQSRCNRQLGKRFGDQAYAMEELVAELGAAFLCADLKIADQPRADHAQYIDHWLGVLKRDKKALFAAASKASKAATYIGQLGGLADDPRGRCFGL